MTEKKFPKSPDRPTGQVLRPKEIPSPGWPPTAPERRYQVPGPPITARAPDEKNSPSAESGKFKKNKYQTLSDASEILQNPSTHCTWLACKKSAQKSKCGVVQNSPSAEFGKLEKKYTKCYPVPLKLCTFHLRIVLSLPSAQNSKCGVVQNSPSYPIPPKIFRVHPRIVLSLPAKNQPEIPSVAWCKTPQVIRCL